MNKTSTVFIASLIMALCFSSGTAAQSSQQQPDQRALTKKLIGTWIYEADGDSTILWEVIPEGMGYLIKARLQAKGVTYMSVNGLMGFEAGGEHVVAYLMLPDGGIMKDEIRFVSDTEVTYDRYYPQNPNHIGEIMDVKFISPDKYMITYKYRGMKETWDDAVITERTYTRVNK